MASKGLMQEIDWEANLRNLYYDLAGAPTPEVVHALLSVTTPDHLLYGSDYPYQPENVLKAGLKRLQDWMSKDLELSVFLPGLLDGNAKTLFHKRQVVPDATATRIIWPTGSLPGRRRRA